MPTRSYRLETNDPLEGKEVFSIKDEKTARLIWSKTRTLTEDEIVSTVFDSHQSPRFTLHRPRTSITSSTSNGSPPPWPRYLVIRSPSFPNDQYVPLIDVQKEDSTSTRRQKKQQKDDTLEFGLSVPTTTKSTKDRRTKPTGTRRDRPSPLNLSSQPDFSLTEAEEEEEEDFDSRTPTLKKKEEEEEKSKNPRPRSATYRVDMIPTFSFTQDSSTSSTTTTKVDLKDPLSSSSDSDPTPSSTTRHRIEENPSKAPPKIAKFRLQPFLPPPSVLDERSKEVREGLGKRVWKRLRSFVVEEGGEWSCVSTTTTTEESKEEEERVVMYFVEDIPTLFPSPLKGTLTLSTELVDESGYEPSFWVAVAMGWMECREEMEGWKEGRRGD
ncbi:hypothetical protein JCM16303_005494 [Sporobolomyces ruberrimus]